MDSWLPEWAVEKYGRFGAIALPWWWMGFNVVPMHPRGKHPLHKFGYQGPDYVPRPGLFKPPLEGWHLTDSPHQPWEVIQAWMEQWEFANAAILPGRANVMIFDVDRREHRDGLVAGLGESTPFETFTRRGNHLFYRGYGVDLGMGAKTYKIPYDDKAMIDHRHSGGYVAAPGSTHTSGAEYGFKMSYEDLINLAKSKGPGALDCLPTLDAAKEKALRTDRSQATVRSSSNGGKKVARGTKFVFQGSVSPDQEVLGEDENVYTLGNAPEGLGLYAWDRIDETPAVRIAIKDGKRWVFDWGNRHFSWIVSKKGPDDDRKSIIAGLTVQGLSDPGKPITLKESVDGAPQAVVEPAANTGSIVEGISVEAAAEVEEDDEFDIDFPLSPNVDLPLVDYASEDPFSLEEIRKDFPEVEVEHVVLDPDDPYITDKVLALEAEDPADMVFFASPPGTGKTETFHHFWNNGEHKTKMAITPRVSLAQNIARRLGDDVKSYQDKEAIAADELATTIHSVLLFAAEARDLLVIDEISACLDQLLSPNSLVRDQVAALMHLLNLIKDAGKVYLGDADLQPWHIWFLLRACKGKRVRIYTHAHKRREKIRVTNFDKGMAEMLKTLDDVAAGRRKNMGIQTDIKAHAHAMEGYITARYPKLRTLCITAENSDEVEVHAKIEYPDETLRNYDVIIHNTAIDTGVSFTEHVDKVFTFYGNHAIHPKSVNQMLMRFRNVGERVVGTKPWKEGNRPENAALIWDAHVAGQAAQTKLLKEKLGTGYNMTLDGGYRIDNPNFEEGYFACAIETVRALNRRQETMFADLRTRFLEVDVDETLPTPEQAEAVLDFRKRMKLIKEVQEQEYQEDVAEAEDITTEQANAIDKKHIRTRDEKLAMAKRKNRDFYDREVTPELVSRDKRGKTKAKLTALARLRMLLEGHADHFAFLEAERNRGRTGALQRMHYLETTILAHLLRVGLELDAEDDGTCEDWVAQASARSFSALELIERLWPIIEEWRGALVKFGILGKIPSEKADVVRWFNGLLKGKFDIRTDRSKHGSGTKGKVWHYRYLIDEPLELGAPAYERLKEGYETAKQKYDHQTNIKALRFHDVMIKVIEANVA